MKFVIVNWGEICLKSLFLSEFYYAPQKKVMLYYAPHYAKYML